MSKTAVIYWSATGNTKLMAEHIRKGIAETNTDVSLFTAGEFGNKNPDDYAKIAFGCPSMGNEALEENEFEPFFASIEHLLPNKPVALFGSYGWGDGEWMRNWEERVRKSGAILFEQGMTVNLGPDKSDLVQCAEFGRRFAEFNTK